jgi:acyl-CoA thioesterase FadM
MDKEPRARFVTASLKVDYINPTPLGVRLMARGKVKEIGKRKVSVLVEVLAKGSICARGEVIAVRIPESMKQR